MPLASVLLTILVAPSAAPEGVEAAITRGVARLEQAAESYTKHRQCFSCHHQAMPILALAAAKAKGFAVNAKVLERQVKFTLDTFRPKLADVREGKAVGGANTTVAYALRTLEAVDHPADEVTAALARFLVVRQKDDGSWPATTKRPPTEGSMFTSAAFAIQSLKRYSPSGDAPEVKELREKIAQALEKGTAWLGKSEAADTEDRVFRLLALVAGADAKVIEKTRDDLLQRQLDDGSWAQLPEAKGDAYATGSVLYALRRAGLPAKDAAYVKAVKYLIDTQHESGGWIVETRSKPIQTFFDNGDPGGKSQFISTAATGWAILALLEAVEVKK